MAQQQSEHPDNLTKTNSLLQATADCTITLLSDDNFERGVNQALKILGTSFGADRLGIDEHIEDITGQTIGHVIVLPYEWLSDYAASQFSHPKMKIIPYDGIEELYEQLKVGQHWGGLIETFSEPFRSYQRDKLGVKSTYAIPITIDGEYWGLIGLDFCRTARELCEAEIAVLKTAAACIGSAIERERDRQTKEEAQRKALLEQQKAIELQERDRLLNLTASATQALLNNEDLDNAIANALEIIGEGIATDRVCVMEHYDNTTGETLGYLQALYEWHSDYAVSQLQHPELQQVNYEGIEEWYESFKRGEAAGGVIEEIPEPVRSGQKAIGVKSTYAVPIAIDGEYWGVVGFDDCQEAQQRSESEISILKTVAAGIGSAIQQFRIRTEREAAQRNVLLEQQKASQLREHNRVLEQRDRILAATAEASNVLLTGAEFDEAVNTALQIIGESIDTDRVCVIENLHNLLKPSIPNWRMSYEWNSACAVSQIADPELSQGSYQGIEEWYELQSQGKTISCRLEEMPEPFRSKMAEVKVKALHVVPIFVEGKHWGVIGIDDCREEIQRSETELSILKTAAACIGGAIDRERTRRAKEQAERNILLEREQAAQERAKLLQAVATVANSLLRSPDYHTALPEVLQILGEAAKSDRCGLVQNIPNPVTGEAAIKLHTEWCREGITRSVESTPELETALLWSDFPQFREKLFQGKISNFLIDELSEPARSILQAQGNISMTLVPIMVQGEFWGVFGFDYCQEVRLFEEADTAVFAIAVDSIAAAIAREQQDEALRASEKRYRTLFELSNEGIYRFEFDEPISTSLSVEEQLEFTYQYFRIAEVNSTFINQYSFNSSEDIVDKRLVDIYPEESQTNLESNRAIIENSYQIRNAETEEIDADGQRRYFLQNIVGDVRDGYFWGGWGVQTDITELKQAQQALLEAERQRVAQLEQSNRVLSLRDRWLEATALAANQLLATPDLDAGINAALKMLGESLDCDRVGVFQCIYNQESANVPTLGHLIYEWNSSHVSSQLLNPELKQIPVSDLGEEWIERLMRGEWVGSVVDELAEPFRHFEIEVEAQSTYIVPFFLNGTWWGTVSIDYCREAKRLTLPEIAVFKTAASCVGSAIYRQQIQTEKEQAEKQRLIQLEQSNQVLSLRDRWLEATALAANQLLATPDLDAGINAALKMLGESLDCDRIGVCQHFEGNIDEPIGFLLAFYEWNSSFAIPQIKYPEHNKISWQGMEDWLVQMKGGEFTGGTVKELILLTNLT
ncbi:GAF domain-containing protein [Pleurocapsa sp. PCC 7319]|uniref:GAF domain-containing protein n=1 Tax=Pleurocapsa sp. PCC 7319 TaxID=118161 RepID=UPI00034D4E97|nr:GAF domain-containing protein [Pleurocapsa sp. PCC 7319]